MSINRKFFFDSVRASLFGGSLNQSQVRGMNVILDVWETSGSNRDNRWLAYALGTCFHETDEAMQPIEEYGRGRGKLYGTNLKADKKTRYTDTKNLFYGRGDVQLTWYDNYEKVGKIFAVDLINHPEKALEPELAANIMFYGMEHGIFTGKKFADFFNAAIEDWKNARKIINVLDCAEKIADYGKKFHAAISYTS